MAVVLLTAAVLLGACGDSGGSVGTSTDDGRADRPLVVATTTILGDLTRRVAGDAADVTTMMPDGADPHSFEPSAQQRADLQRADLIVANGANLEEGLHTPLADAQATGVPIFRATDHIDTLSSRDGNGHASDGHASDEHAEAVEAHDHGTVDPHFWMDPTRAATVVRALGTRLTRLTGDDEVTAQAGAYARRLEDLDDHIAKLLADVPAARRVLVTNHDALSYFADRYDFTIAGTVIPSVTTGAEPSARDLQDLANVITAQRVPAIFAEDTASAQLVDTLARESGNDVQVVQLYSDSLGGPARSYVDMMTIDAGRIGDALGR